MADVKKTNKAPKVTKKVEEVKTVAQLQEELTKLRGEHLESRKSHRGGELVNPHILNTQRKAIARVMTALNASKATAVKEEN